MTQSTLVKAHLDQRQAFHKSCYHLLVPIHQHKLKRVCKLFLRRVNTSQEASIDAVREFIFRKLIHYTLHT